MRVIATPITITPTALPDAQQGSAYTQQLTASGGSGSGYVFTVISGSLPPGLTLSSDGLVSGTPTTAGTFPFGIKVTDSNGSSQNFTL